MSEKIILGSGDLYLAEYTGSTLPTVQTLKVDANKIGSIQGGATLEYTKENYTAKSDNGKQRKTVLTNETVMLKPGICSVDKEKLAKICSTVNTTTSASVTTVKIGGLANDDGKKYAILFYQTDAQDGDMSVRIVGKNTAGLTFTFKKDAETVLNLEFEAIPCDTDGRLVYLDFFPVA